MIRKKKNRSRGIKRKYKLRTKHKLRERSFGSTLKNFSSLWYCGLVGK